MFWSKPTLGSIGEGGEIFWTAKEECPDRKIIVNATDSLVALPTRIPKGKGLITRGRDHAISWIYSYAKTECEILDKEFLSEGRSYELILLRSEDKSELNLIFRLSTIGIEGWTQYRAAWRKIDDDKYVCLEP